ncbi:hypothetical protein Nepgr_017471 [Nepenthes gracilis]|uniref:Uncharacterized protein n=1 Tax=Nepenthes gracilis TaxID=150966 RepID=A0AAD3XTE0_NEPGR|nr:hypothetical protein Nepgr_017471 [Nepenthes gracilis]
MSAAVGVPGGINELLAAIVANMPRVASLWSKILPFFQICLRCVQSWVIELKTFMLETLCVFKNNKALDLDMRGLWWLSGDVNSVSQLPVD